MDATPPFTTRPELRGTVGMVASTHWLAPAAATISRFRELGLDLVPGTGLLAACVPGAFDAWLLLLRDFGTLPLAEVMRFPIHYAEAGFPMLPRIAETIAEVEALFVSEWTSSA